MCLETGGDSAASPGWESSSNRRIPDLQSKDNVLTSFSVEGARLLISGSQVRALVRPPPSLQVSNSPGDTRICPVNSGLFRVRPCLRVSLYKTKRRIWTLRLCIEKFRSRLGASSPVRVQVWGVSVSFKKPTPRSLQV